MRVVKGHLLLLWREVALWEVQGRLPPDRASAAPSMRLARVPGPRIQRPTLSRTLQCQARAVLMAVCGCRQSWGRGRGRTATRWCFLRACGSLCRSEAMAGVSTRALRGRSALPVDTYMCNACSSACISSGHVTGRACMSTTNGSLLHSYGALDNLYTHLTGHGLHRNNVDAIHHTLVLTLSSVPSLVRATCWISTNTASGRTAFVMTARQIHLVSDLDCKGNITRP